MWEIRPGYVDGCAGYGTSSASFETRDLRAAHLAGHIGRVSDFSGSGSEMRAGLSYGF